MAAHWTLGCDAADPQRLATFWALALGYAKEAGFDDPDAASIVDPDDRGPAIGFLRVPEGKIGKTACTWTSASPAGPRGTWQNGNISSATAFLSWWPRAQSWFERSSTANAWARRDAGP